MATKLLKDENGTQAYTDESGNIYEENLDNQKWSPTHKKIDRSPDISAKAAAQSEKAQKASKKIDAGAKDVKKGKARGADNALLFHKWREGDASASDEKKAQKIKKTT